MGNFVSSLVTSAQRYITSIAPQFLVPRNAIQKQEANPSPSADAGPSQKKKKNKKKKKKKRSTTEVSSSPEAGASLSPEGSSSKNSPPIAQSQDDHASPSVDLEEGGWTVVGHRGKMPHRTSRAGPTAYLSLQIDPSYQITYASRETLDDFVRPKSFGAFKTAFLADDVKIRDHDPKTVEKWIQIANEIRGHGTDEERKNVVEENMIAQAIYSSLIRLMKENRSGNPQIGWAYLGLAKVESSSPHPQPDTERKVCSYIENALKSNPTAPCRAACFVFLGDILKRSRKFEESFRQYSRAYDSGASGDIRGKAALGMALFLHKEAERMRKDGGPEMEFDQLQKTGNLLKEGIEHLGQHTSVKCNNLLQSARKQMLYSVGNLAYQLGERIREYPDTNITPFLGIAECAWDQSSRLSSSTDDDHARQTFAKQVYNRLSDCIGSANGNALAKRMVPFATSLYKSGYYVHDNTTNRRKEIIDREAVKFRSPLQEGETYSVDSLRGRLVASGRKGGAGRA